MLDGGRDLERLVRDAVAALNAGRGADARALAERATALGGDDAQTWLLLATACRAQSDAAGEEAALDRMLALTPRAVRGLIMKGDCRARAGDERAAVSYYRSAILVGAQEPQPAPVQGELRRAETIMAQLEARYAGRLEASLSARGLPPGARSARFQQSLDIIAGRRQIFIQEPTLYYFPGLPQIQYYDTAQFAWAAAIEAEAGAIRAEIEAVRAGAEGGGGAGFRAYIQAEHNNPRLDENVLLDNSDWSALFLCENGRRDEAAIARCPRSWAAVQAAPLPAIAETAPTVMFSLLRPGARIAPHTGVQNTRLTCHLPLIVPPGCGFRVGNEVRQWEEGKLLVFDDTIEHEAWNESGADRLVLIFDIWRPELSAQERDEVSALFTMR